MWINRKSYSTEDVKNFLYKKNATFSENVQTFFNRVSEFFRNFCWINNKEVFNSLKPNSINEKKIVVEVFRGIDIDDELTSKIDSFSQEITLFEQNEIKKRDQEAKKAKAQIEFDQKVTNTIEHVRKLAKKPEEYGSQSDLYWFFYYEDNREGNNLYRLISLSFKEPLKQDEKEFIYNFDPDVFKRMIVKVNKTLEKVDNLKKMGVDTHLNDWKEKRDQFFNNALSNIFKILSPEEERNLNLSEEEQNLLDSLKDGDNESKMNTWLKKSKKPSVIKEVDISLRKKIEIALQIDKKIEEYQKLVNVKINLNYVILESSSSDFEKALKMLNKNPGELSLDEKLQIINCFKNEPYLAGSLAAIADKHRAWKLPPLDHIQSKNLEFVRHHPLYSQMIRAVNDLKQFPYIILDGDIPEIIDIQFNPNNTQREKLSKLDQELFNTQAKAFLKIVEKIKLYDRLNIIPVNGWEKYQVSLLEKDFDLVYEHIILDSWIKKELFPFLQEASKSDLLNDTGLTHDQRLVYQSLKEIDELSDETCLKIFREWVSKMDLPEDLYATALSVILSQKYALRIPLSPTDNLNFKRFIEENVDIPRLKALYSTSNQNRYCAFLLNYLYDAKAIIEKTSKASYGGMATRFRVQATLSDFIPQAKPELTLSFEPGFIGHLMLFIQKNCAKTR